MATTDPRIATEGQWADLAARVKAKADASNVPNITMTNVDPGEGSALAANNYIAVYGGDPIIMDYSTNEVNTGAKWIDGSAIYKKTINFGALPNNTSKTVAHGISNIANVIKIEGVAMRPGSPNQWNPLPLVYRGDDASYDGELYANDTNVGVVFSADRSIYTSSYITLYYTKSS